MSRSFVIVLQRLRRRVAEAVAVASGCAERGLLLVLDVAGQQHAGLGALNAQHGCDSAFGLRSSS